MVEKDCTEIGFAEKSKATAGEKVRGQKIEICGGEHGKSIFYRFLWNSCT